MPHMKNCLALALCPLLLCFAAACGREKGPEPPEAYAIGEESAPPLDNMMEDTGKLKSVEDESQEEAGGRQVYTYEDLPSGGETAEDYAAELEEQGFQVVDEEGRAGDAPDYGQTSGTVHLAKDSASQQGYRFQINLDWTEQGCVVTVEMAEGKVSQPEQQGMTLREAVGYVKSLSPALLGLHGETMEDYNIYPMEGNIMVDGRPCLRLQIYQQTGEGTNQVVGIYLLSSDRMHLYRLDEVEKTVQELPLQGRGVAG